MRLLVVVLIIVGLGFGFGCLMNLVFPMPISTIFSVGGGFLIGWFITDLAFKHKFL